MATKQVVVKKKTPKALEPFGDSIPHAEPAWYQGFASPYYRASHIELRNKIRKFMEEEVIPFQEEWIEKGAYPKELHRRVYELGISGIIYPKEYGGTPPADYDAFHEQILWDELGRCGGGGVLGQLSINSMALPPIIHYGSKYLKDLVLRDVIEGRKSCALMISEPTAGSDVSNIKATARREGDYYVINGEKKWITGGHMADFFTALVRTGGEGPAGLSVVVIPRDTPGISIRKMKTQFDSCHGTTFVILEDVKVPVQNLVGKEGMGAAYLMINFNHERLVIAVGVLRSCRICYQESMREALTRKTFGKRLIEHDVVKYLLAEMARQIEALAGFVDNVTYQFAQGVPDNTMGAQCALLKVQASKTFEFCAREASQMFGGSGLVREGRGKVVERLYREVRGVATPGGAESILLLLATREAAKGFL